MDLEELYHKYRVRLEHSLFTTFASIGLVVCTITLTVFILFYDVSFATLTIFFANVYQIRRKTVDVEINTVCAPCSTSSTALELHRPPTYIMCSMRPLSRKCRQTIKRKFDFRSQDRGDLPITETHNFPFCFV